MNEMRWPHWFNRPHLTSTVTLLFAIGMTAAMLLAPATSEAQIGSANASLGLTPLVRQPSAPAGYSLHGTINMGGHMANITGSDAMYDTLINLHSGPRVLGETLKLQPLKTNKHPLFDHLTVFSNGFGGDPFNFTQLKIEKGKYYQFTGTFRRARQYFDYDLLGNPNIVSGKSIPIGPVNNPTGSLAWPQVRHSPFLFNAVRRMLDTNLTLLPEARVTYRFEYSHQGFEGPSLSPGGFIGQSDLLLEEHQRNGTDFFMGEIDWKPVRDTQFTYQEIVDHYKDDSYFTIAPSQFIVQESDGTPAAVGGWDSQTPYGINYCNTGSMTGPYTILSPPQTPGGKPVINPACDVFTSYMRSAPTRILYPTEIFRFQSATLKKLEMNGNIRYTDANMNLPHYYENIQGLDGQVRSTTFTGHASAKREVLAMDYGMTWQMSPKWELSEALSYSNVQQPGSVNVSKGATLETPGDPNATINYAGTLTPGPSATVEGNPNGTLQHGFFGQKRFTNNVTETWNGWSRGSLSLTYRYHRQMIAEGVPHSAPLALGATSNGTVLVQQNGGILNAAFDPTSRLMVNGSIAVFYSDNAFTPISPRREQRYRMHVLYQPKSWLTITGSYNDREVHNNTNNQQAAVAAGKATYAGPIDHVYYSRVLGAGASITPNQYLDISFNYGYTDIYTSTNICYNAAASPTLPGAATPSGTACPGATVRGTHYYEFGPTADYERSPTQYGTVYLGIHPVKSLSGSLGYNINSVNGSRFYNDTRDVAGSLVSTYQSPFVKLNWAVRKGLIWDAQYNYYGYGEGGPSGAEYCSTSNPTPGNPVTVVPCSSLVGLQTGMTISSAGETAPRNFHANIVTLGMHYQF